MNASVHPSVQSIHRRLSLLLLRAFLVVVTLIIVLLLVITGLALVHSETDYPMMTEALPIVLETYYLGHGSWEGVETLFVGEQAPLAMLHLQWQQTALLDETGQVLIENGRVVTPGVQMPPPDAEKGAVPLVVDGRQVGSLVRATDAASFRLGVIMALLLPVAIFSIVLGLLTLVIGMLLTRRVVQPLAEVIAASQSVASGDLSARVQVQGPDDLIALTDSFNQMAGALERSQAERRNLLADIAHELRTPLTVIRGKLEGILDGVYPADEAHVAPVLEETYLMERLVEDLRLVTLVEGGQLHFDPKPLDLGELARQACSLFEAQAAEKRIRLSLDVEAASPEVHGDAQRTSQVIGNLLSNALEFTPEDGEVRVVVGAQNGSGRLAVWDTGPGVPPTELSQIFDRFWRSDKSRARQTGGSGLGLAIARQLVEAQGGLVFAKNRAQGGLEVGFTLGGSVIKLKKD